MIQSIHGNRQTFPMLKGIITSFFFIVFSASILQSQCPINITFSSQSQINSFPINYPNCTEIEGNVTIITEDIYNLNGLSALTSIGWGLNILGTSLVDLSGLDNVTTIGGSLTIAQSPYYGVNSHLVSLSGLNSLTSIGGVFLLKGNIVLSDISSLSNLSTIGATLQIVDNDSLKTLSGFNSLEHIGNHLIIDENYALQSLVGFDVLSSITVSLFIWENESLIDFSGMDSLEYVGGMIGISRNSSLTNISSLSNLTTLGHSISIVENGQLVDISGLINIDSLSGGGDIDIRMNHALTSLSGLDSISAESITGLIISDNGFLSECAVKSICDYLADPNGEITIYSNDTGCDTQAEVEEACIVGITELSSDPVLSAYPNPTHSEIIISGIDDFALEEVSIYNTTGQCVLHQQGSDRRIDVSSLQQGLYVVEVVTDKARLREKLIKR